MSAGVWAAVGCFVLWGFLPAYFKYLEQVQPTEILTHRIVWSFVFVVVILVLQRHLTWIRSLWNRPKLIGLSALCALLLSTNWLVYIWAVSEDHIIEASLGYFINPLLNVALGMIFLGERLRPMQAVAIAIATGGVVYMTLALGSAPWIALALAFSFGFYGLLRKQSHLGSTEGLSLETALILFPALGYLLYLTHAETLSFGGEDLGLNLLLIGTGIATALPLLLFAYAARQISLTLLGLLQYIGPSIQMLLAIYIYGEAFEGPRVIGFVLIWTALVIYSLETLVYRGRTPRDSIEKRSA